MTKFDGSELNIEKNIVKNIFSKKGLKNVRTREFESGEKNFFPENI